MKRLACGIALMGLLTMASSALAQRQPETLRAALMAAGFEEAVSAPGAPDLTRALFSVKVASLSDTVVVAYCYVDASAKQGFSPPGISRFDRASRQWSQRDLDDLKGGYFEGLTVDQRYVTLMFKISPSANDLHVFDSRTLKPLAQLFGYTKRTLNDGSLLFSGGVVHFAPYHKETLRVFSPATQDVTVFPGTIPSVQEAGFRARLQAFVNRLPENERKANVDLTGDPAAFDRSVDLLSVRDDDGRLGLIAGYSTRLGLLQEGPRLTTVVRCDRKATADWSCVERSVADQERIAGISVTRDAEGYYDRRGLQALVQSVLREP